MGREDKLQDWVQEARERLWDAEHIRRNDMRQHGESDEHWHHRRNRNKERVEHREEVVKHLRKKLEALRDAKEHDDPDIHSGDWRTLIGYGTFDGKRVPAWTVYWLNKSRASDWGGIVVSGVRTVQESIDACENMCHAPYCPGRCAGATSNHNMEPNQGYPAGALDVTDYDNFERLQYEIGSPLRNDLPIDPVHFSVTGH